MLESVLTVAEAAKVLRLSRALVYQLASKGEIPSIRIGRSVRIPAPALEAWVRARTEPGR